MTKTCVGCGGGLPEHPAFSKWSPETVLCEGCVRKEDVGDKKANWLEEESTELIVEALECYASVNSHCGDYPEQRRKNARAREVARLIREAGTL